MVLLCCSAAVIINGILFCHCDERQRRSNPVAAFHVDLQYKKVRGKIRAVGHAVRRHNSFPREWGILKYVRHKKGVSWVTSFRSWKQLCAVGKGRLKMPDAVLVFCNQISIELVSPLAVAAFEHWRFNMPLPQLFAG